MRSVHILAPHDGTGQRSRRIWHMSNGSRTKVSWGFPCQAGSFESRPVLPFTTAFAIFSASIATSRKVPLMGVT
ncbi:hypothetical protein RKD19_004652 [Streptomyces canus]